MMLEKVAADEVPDRHGGEHEIDVFNESFERRVLQFDRDRVTGREIIHKLGYHPVDDFIVLHWHHDGAVEDVGLEEQIDLKGRERNAFFVNKASETFNIVINDVRVTWTQVVVTGETLKRLARVSIDDTDLYLERPDAPEKLIEDEDTVDLHHRGIEHFRTRAARIVEITVNVTHKVKIRRGIHTGAEIKAAAIAQGVPIKESFTLSQELPDGGSKVIGNDDPVRIKGGEEFLAIDDHDDSQP
jgi:hypothetical protein